MKDELIIYGHSDDLVEFESPDGHIVETKPSSAAWKSKAAEFDLLGVSDTEFVVGGKQCGATVAFKLTATYGGKGAWEFRVEALEDPRTTPPMPGELKIRLPEVDRDREIYTPVITVGLTDVRIEQIIYEEEE